jgi:hypothetical protein
LQTIAYFYIAYCRQCVICGLVATANQAIHAVLPYQHISQPFSETVIDLAPGVLLSAPVAAAAFIIEPFFAKTLPIPAMVLAADHRHRAQSAIHASPLQADQVAVSSVRRTEARFIAGGIFTGLPKSRKQFC